MKKEGTKRKERKEREREITHHKVAGSFQLRRGKKERMEDLFLVESRSGD